MGRSLHHSAYRRSSACACSADRSDCWIVPGWQIDHAVAHPSPEAGVRCADRRGRSQDPVDRDLRSRRPTGCSNWRAHGPRWPEHNLDQALAERAHAHAARPGALEIRDRRQLRAERREPAVARLELTHSLKAEKRWTIVSHDENANAFRADRLDRRHLDVWPRPAMQQPTSSIFRCRVTA